MQDNSGPAVATTLRAIAAWLESHPEIKPYSIAMYPAYWGHGPIEVDVYDFADGGDLATTARTLGGRWDKEAGELYKLRQEIAPGAVVVLAANRSTVCERVVTGTTTVTEPDPEALAQVPTVTREVETYDWVCAPLLEATS